MIRVKSGALFLCWMLLVTTGCVLPLEGRSGFGGEGGEGSKGGAGGQGGPGGAQTSSMTTGGVVDTTSPTVVSSIPANSASKVAVGAPISATFSEALDPSTIT